MTHRSKQEYLIYKLSDEMKRSTRMDAELFKKLDVKRGLRNEDGSGVLVGLTNIGNVVGYKRDAEGRPQPIEGQLFFRGYEVKDLVHAIIREKRFGFEEVAFLLLSGRLPDAEELQAFKELIFENMPLEHQTILHIIELEGDDIMNILARSVMEFYTFDENPDDTSRDNLMRQSIELISKFPTTIAYAFNMYRHKEHGRSLHIRDAKPGLSLAENFLFMLKGADYTELDARTLDLLLILHSEHGGGNNSTFTVRVTSSTGTDTFSSIAAGIGSLKGPKHGGANLKVCEMLAYLKDEVSNWNNEAEIEDCITRILNREVLDRSGLVYGIGHAVYTLSDPRTVLLKEMARDLAIEKGRLDEFEFMERVERVAIATTCKLHPNVRALCANVDFYSGFVYDCIGIPREIYTPLFAMARIVGWCAHRNEELNFEGRRIIRPAYRCITDENAYIPIEDR
ncbi:MAG: citrate synthase [Bacteroidales bacterium]|nr:citrate synthase [Bacteroidales bacterium]MCR5277017.1 citrate synthase [Bacteroidales bacterium]